VLIQIRGHLLQIPLLFDELKQFDS